MAVVAIAVLMGAVVGWAASVALTPPRDVLESTAYTYVEVVEGEVGSSINLNTVAEWSPIPVGSNLAAGTVTSIAVSPGQELAAGAVLYTVNLRPVLIGQGDIPAFQSLTQGMKGADVAQLQNLLSTLGLYKGPADGVFGQRLTAAVKSWQKSLGIAVDGTVQAGDVVFVPSLPTRVALDQTIIKRGASLSGGESVVTGLPPSPLFTVPVTDTQAALMPAGTRVEITGPAAETWEGFVVDQTTDENQAITAVLAGKDGATICGDACGSIPVTEKSLLSSRIVTVEAVTGLTVPSAALLSRADGTLSVIDDAGVETEVTVVTSARGMSVIDGVASGTRVRVPASAG
ncbi:MAG: hypothetical protein RI885_672 [Actinomycetota bacterium]|jgi:peptidoglycan hydrolase-like protein with peptidoglycan-binding domain